uniref:Uncharacterized protein n=1 Tax=Amphimedon queenslandica TaxID=400682 RepID=A0A1X7SJZ7_AMPQE
MEDYSAIYNAMENFRRQLEALELPMVGILKWMNLIYLLIATTWLSKLQSFW